MVDLSELEGKLEYEVRRRRGLGGYSTDAEGILLLSEILLELIQYIKAPKKGGK